jgi:hypothetical protein
MKWAIIFGIVILLLPFYAYIISKCVYAGKLMAEKLFKEKENKDGEKRKEEQV